MLFEHSVLVHLVKVLIQVQLPRAFLQFVDAPLNLAKVPLGVRLENADGFEHVSDLYLLDELIETAFKHAVLGTLLAKAAAALRNEPLDVECEGAEHAPVDVLVLADALLFVHLFDF